MNAAAPMEGERRLDVPGGSPEPIPGRCGRKRSQGPGFCKKLPVAGRTACMKHGGLSLRGSESGTFVHGRHSKFLPQKLLERFEEAQADPDRLSYGSEISLLDARIGELLERSQSRESGSAWRLAEKLWKDFQRFRAAGNDGKVQETLTALAEPLETGLRDHHGWAEIGEAIDRRARLVSLEQQRLKELQASLTVNEAMSLISVILDCLRRHVEDPAILQAIGDDLAHLINLDTVPIGARSRRARR